MPRDRVKAFGELELIGGWPSEGVVVCDGNVCEQLFKERCWWRPLLARGLVTVTRDRSGP